MTNTNIEIKTIACQNGVRLYEIALHLGKSESWLNRKLRKELSAEEHERFLAAIREIATQRQTV